jgi:hypothetical protein
MRPRAQVASCKTRFVSSSKKNEQGEQVVLDAIDAPQKTIGKIPMAV